MSHRPQTAGPIRVPETLRPAVTFAWPTTPVGIYTDLGDWDAALAYWYGKNATATSIVDAGFFAHPSDGTLDATLHGGMYATEQRLVPSQSTGALYCNGTDAYATAYASGGTFDVALLSYTWECWVSIEPTGSRVCVLSKGDSAGSGGYAIYIETDGTVSALVDGFVTAAHPAILTDARPHHIGLRLDRTTNVLQFVVDGVPGDEYDATPLTGLDISSASQVGIGCENFVDSPALFFRGLIDHIAVYRLALSVERLIAHYRSGMTPPTGVVGSSGFRFNGVSNQYSISDVSAWPVSVPGSGFAIAATTVISFTGADSNIAVTSGNVFRAMPVTRLGGTALSVQSGSVKYYEATNSATITSITASCVTRQGTTLRAVVSHTASVVTLWLNGTAVGTTAPSSWSTRPGAVFIGGWSYGAFRDLYIFNRPLTAGEVVRLDGQLP